MSDIGTNTTDPSEVPTTGTDTPVAGWRVYYTDGREYDSTETSWADLPDDGVLLLRLYYDRHTDGGVRYTKSLSGDDHYFHVPGTALFGCNNDPIDEIEARYPGAIVKRGMWTTQDDMWRVKDAARAAPCPTDSS